MSIIAVSTIFLTKAYGPDEMILVEKILTKLGNEIRSTRKGRYWEVVKNNSLFYVDVRSTESRLHDYEDELLVLNLLPEDAPETISITSSLGREQDLDFVSLLSGEIATKLRGISNGAKYSS